MRVGRILVYMDSVIDFWVQQKYNYTRKIVYCKIV